MATFNQTFGTVGQVINTESVVINGQNFQVGAPANMAEASREIGATRDAVQQLEAVPAEVREEAAQHLEAAKTAAETAPQDKQTVEGHLDKAASVLKSATGVAGEVAGVVAAVVKIAAAVAAFVV